MTRSSLPDISVYLVTDRSLARGRDLVDVVARAVQGGVTMVQLREKECSTRQFVELGLALKRVLDPQGVPLLINDRVDVALAVGAAGAHIGQSDMPYPTARRILGPEAIIGLSIDDLDQLAEAEAWDVDYLGVGPVFATSTKLDAGAPLGMDGLARCVQDSRHRIVAIGSMNAENAGPAIKAGAQGVAVVSHIMSADSPAQAAADLAEAIVNAKM